LSSGFYRSTQVAKQGGFVQMSFKPYVWVLAVAVGTGITGGTVGAVASPAMNNQAHHEDHSKNKSYQQGLRGGLANPAHNRDQFRKWEPNKDGDQKAYGEVAWLVGQMNNPANAASVSDINRAILEILDPASTGFFNRLTNNGLASDKISAKEDSPGWWLAQAQEQTYTEGQFSHRGSMRPFTGTQREGDSPKVVSTPESPTPILLGADLLGLATLIFLFRRRMLRTQS
jgi:hypothetical protein